MDADEKWEALLAEGAEWLNKPVQPPGLGRSGACGGRGQVLKGEGWWLLRGSAWGIGGGPVPAF